MKEKDDYKSLEISGAELDQFIKDLVTRLYNQIWADISVGPDETVIKERLEKSIIEALKEYAIYRADEK
jgi:hypothetical protein